MARKQTKCDGTYFGISADNQHVNFALVLEKQHEKPCGPASDSRKLRKKSKKLLDCATTE